MVDRVMPGVLRAVRKQTLEEDVYAAIREAIVTGAFPPGSRLVQETIAANLAVSRIPVRDALQRLETEGLVDVDARGTRTVATFTDADIVEIYDLRVLLECEAARHAVPLASGIGELEELVDRMQHHVDQGDKDSYVVANQRFHFAIYDACGRSRLLRMIRTMWNGATPLTPIGVPGQLERSQRGHRKILDAVRSGDPDQVVEHVRAHIVEARDAMRAHFAGLPDSGARSGS